MTEPADPKTRPKWKAKGPLPALAPGEVRLLTGGNPQITKGDGDAPVQAYIAAMPGWKRMVGVAIDALVVETCPGVIKAVRWNAPFWGMPGQGAMLSLGCVTAYVKICFHNGAALTPMPPVESKHADVRYVHMFEGAALEEAQFRSWLLQAARIKGTLIFT